METLKGGTPAIPPGVDEVSVLWAYLIQERSVLQLDGLAEAMQRKYTLGDGLY